MTINIIDVYIKIYEYFSLKFTTWKCLCVPCLAVCCVNVFRCHGGAEIFFPGFKFLSSSFRVERGSKVARLLPPWVPTRVPIIVLVPWCWCSCWCCWWPLGILGPLLVGPSQSLRIDLKQYCDRQFFVEWDLISSGIYIIICNCIRDKGVAIYNLPFRVSLLFRIRGV